MPALVQELTAWFRAHGRDLPWRAPDPDPWGILVVEVMSQQTPIARVLPTWREWTARWPTPADLAAAGPAEVIRSWGRLGYPRRALALRQAAGEICDRFGGRVPDREEDLLSLPGVGPYTAAAVRAFAFGERAVVLDTNIRRVLTRILEGVALPPAHVRAGERRRAEELVPEEGAAAAEWNAAVMEFGALVCTARAPDCPGCPVSSCAWREAGFPDNAPARRSQPWQGSDRQVRGAIMALMRGATGPVTWPALRDGVVAAHPKAQPSQVERALEGLLADRLLTRTGGRAYTLPQ